MVAPAILGAAGTATHNSPIGQSGLYIDVGSRQSRQQHTEPDLPDASRRDPGETGKYDDAVDAYTKIKDKYFQSYQAMDIDKYIEQAKLMKK